MIDVLVPPPNFMVPQEGPSTGGRRAIGIDPGQSTGFAVYDGGVDALIEVRTTHFWEAVYSVLRYPKNQTSLYVEVPNTKHVWHKAPANIKAAQRQGVNVGGAIREAVLMADGLELAGYTVHRIHPRGKVAAKRFSEYTGWTGRTNQHERDAALLCYGRN